MGIVAVANLDKTVPTTDELKQRIEQALPGADVQVEDLNGGGDHFRAEVVSDRFQGLSRIEQHRLVYEGFGNEIGGAVHAPSPQTTTPAGANGASPPTNKTPRFSRRPPPDKRGSRF